jgi:hypothetical protein
MPSTERQERSASESPASLKRLQSASCARSRPELDLSADSRARLETLLTADVVELKRVCDEIHSVPPLANLIVKLGGSLGSYPSASPATVEEAIVLLGTSRLRVLVDAWPFSSLAGTSESRYRIIPEERATVLEVLGDPKIKRRAATLLSS